MPPEALWVTSPVVASSVAPSDFPRYTGRSTIRESRDGDAGESNSRIHQTAYAAIGRTKTQQRRHRSGAGRLSTRTAAAAAKAKLVLWEAKLSASARQAAMSPLRSRR